MLILCWTFILQARRCSLLSPADSSNFTTLTRAFGDGNVALLEVRRVSDQKAVAAICSMHREGDDLLLTPFALMVEGNPFELFDPPNPDGGFHSEVP